MPTDSKGKFHLNNQKMRHAEKMQNPPAPARSMGEATVADKGEDVPHAKVYDHGDGTGRTEMGDGSYHEHRNIEALKQHLAQFFDEESAEGAGEEKEPEHAGDWA